MSTAVSTSNPAEEASAIALHQIRVALDSNESFLLEAGAGAGKTYSLIETLKFLIQTRGRSLVSSHKQIACITYTNVAADEINARTDSHPAVFCSTIHAFCWAMIKGFQPNLRTHINELEVWQEKIAESDGVSTQTVIYDLGYRRITDKEITLHHDDVISLMVKLLDEAKFRALLAQRFPIIFIDEYQDTNKEFADKLSHWFLDEEDSVILGFFGDHWQKIYGNGCGKIENDNLTTIGKRANFRSVPTIVDPLNRMRPDLTQQVKDPLATGEVSIFHTNSFTGSRRTGAHWAGDLPADVAHDYLNRLQQKLFTQGWEFSPDKTKILMLTHNVLASEQGYSNLAGVFMYNEAFLKKEDAHVSFLVDIVEPACVAYGEQHYGQMFASIGRTPKIQTRRDKQAWARDMDRLMELRQTATVGDVIAHLQTTRRPRLTEAVDRREAKLSDWLASDPQEENRSLAELQQFKGIPYREVIALTAFLNGHTPFNTKHGVKGAEFENVLVVLGRGWNQYNFNQFLEWATAGIPTGKEDTYERNRNLFYVACSRPKKRLCLLFTQELSAAAISTLSTWFGAANVKPFAVA